MTERIEIDPDIRRARTLPAAVYRDRAWFDRAAQRLFPRTWQVAPGAEAVRSPGRAAPWTMLPGCVDEPLALVRDGAGALRVLSNVCTHRGMLVVEGPGAVDQLRCRYHGRRWACDGGFRFMPEFDGVEGFPCPEDDLRAVRSAQWGPLVFASLDPEHDFEALIGPIRERFDWLEVDGFELDPRGRRDFDVAGSWITYIDNFLEGFHVPYVHPALTPMLDMERYRTVLWEHGSAQVAVVRDDQPAFELPEDHPDAGERVGAYFCLLFPNTLLNFYPWGLSVNVVQPLGPERCRVTFFSYVGDPSLRQVGLGADLDQVEREDESIVEAVQTGLRGRAYERGRYSPRLETGPHQFHREIARLLGQGPA